MALLPADDLRQAAAELGAVAAELRSRRPFATSEQDGAAADLLRRASEIERVAPARAAAVETATIASWPVAAGEAADLAALARSVTVAAKVLINSDATARGEAAPYTKADFGLDPGELARAVLTGLKIAIGILGVVAIVGAVAVVYRATRERG